MRKIKVLLALIVSVVLLSGCVAGDPPIDQVANFAAGNLQVEGVDVDPTSVVTLPIAQADVSDLVADLASRVTTGTTQTVSGVKTFTSNLTVPTFVSTGTVRLKGYTVSTLPAGTQGDIAFATDLLTPAFLTVAVGGGAIVGPVFYNGTAWIAY